MTGGHITMGFPLLYYNLYHPEASSQQEQTVKGMAEVSTWRPSFIRIRSIPKDAVHTLKHPLLCGAVALIGRLCRLRNPGVCGRQNFKLATCPYIHPTCVIPRAVNMMGFTPVIRLCHMAIVDHQVGRVYQVVCLIT